MYDEIADELSNKNLLTSNNVIRVLSFNMQGGFAHGKGAVLRNAIDEHNPKVAFLQECGNDSDSSFEVIHDTLAPRFGKVVIPLTGVSNTLGLAAGFPQGTSAGPTEIFNGRPAIRGVVSFGTGSLMLINVHLKSSSGAANEALRKEQVITLLKSTQGSIAVPYTCFIGDLNGIDENTVGLNFREGNKHLGGNALDGVLYPSGLNVELVNKNDGLQGSDHTISVFDISLA